MKIRRIGANVQRGKKAWNLSVVSSTISLCLGVTMVTELYQTKV